MIKYKNQINTTKYILLLGILISILFACLVPKVKAETEVARRYNITSADDLTAYSVAYAAGNRNPDDILDIAINSGSTISKDGFVSIGTSDRPFSGTIITPNSGIEVFTLYGCPLFDYVTTDMEIGGSGTVKIMRAEPSYTQNGVLTEGALFANHVVKGTNAASWNVMLISYVGEDEEDDSFDCVIKDIEASAVVDITFTNEADLNIDGSGNVGLICGTLNENANLAVTTVGTNDNLSVTGTGNVGGLVGSMAASATLTFKSNNNSRISTITSSAGNAGGIVGNAVNPNFVFDGVTDYIVKEDVVGKTYAGGIFGSYQNNTGNKVFTLLDTFNIQSGIEIKATSYAGGIFGYLYNSASSFTFNGNMANETIQVALTSGTYRGGVCGRYRSDSTKRVLNITNTKTNVSTSSTGSYTAGLIGTIDRSVYVNINNCEIETPDLLSGGLIGYISVSGVFVDVSGTIKIKGSGKYKAGLIDKFGTNNYTGLLRIQGTTDLSACKFYNWDSAYIVRERSAVIVYALGDGEGTKGNWTLKRGISVNKTIDTNRINHDIYTWGNVLRVDGTTLKEDDLFTINNTNHTITVKSEKSSISNITDFALTYLNINCNYESTGNVLFESSNKATTLLASDITLNNNINLANTGLNGLLRDNGSVLYSGTFDGTNKTITLAIGETFGLDENGNTLNIATTKTGYVSKHTYNALFAGVENATIKDLNVDGYANLYVSVDQMKFSPLVAYVQKGATIDNVDTDVDVNVIFTGNHRLYVGGLIAYVESFTTQESFELSLAIDSCNAVLDISDTSYAAATTNYIYLGGVIGFINARKSIAQTIDITSSSSDLTYDGQAKARATVFGGIVAYIECDSYSKGRRVITVDDFDITLDIAGYCLKNADGGVFGAVFGYKWASIDAYLSNITVDATISALETGSTGNNNFGGLIQQASGYLELNSLSLTKLDYTLPINSNNTFGLLVNTAWIYETIESSNYHQALYLELNNQDYNIASLAFLNNQNFASFDEVACNSRYHNVAETTNEQSIISISTPNNIISSTTDTYINKTTYGNASGNEINANTRYYYDVKYALDNIDQDKYAFYIFSVYLYAHSTIRSWFNAPTSHSGDLDMTGISYYPADLKGQSLEFNNCTIKLDNVLMQSYVKKATSSLETRSTIAASQHHLMHSSMFINATGEIKIKDSSLQGNVVRFSSTQCGFIVQKILGNSDTIKAKLTLNNVTLDGVYINNNASNHFTSTSSIAPLLVNRIRKNSVITIDGLYQSTSAYSAYTSYYAASSLIGAVGNTSDRTIYMTFTHIKLDGRKASAGAVGNMNTTYGTTRSIFSRAVFLESFTYFSDCTATYNFSIEDDWQNSTTAIHEVTYGQEITNSEEYLDMQKTYSGSSYFISPTNYNQTSETYSFATNYLRYVYEHYDSSASKHEILINQSFESSIKGNGKYGDPFIIDDDDKLTTISEIIFGSVVSDQVKMELPSNLSSFDYLSTSYTSEIYAFGSSEFTSTTTSNTFDTSDVRKYLSEAYYVISKDITLSSTYRSLGENSDYPFKGVIVGSGNPTITNTSPKPLIANTTGCVIKNVTIDVKAGANHVQFQSPSGTQLFNYSSGIPSYGALIGQVLGGDTFIDNVRVGFTSITFDYTTTNNTYECLVPIGGYIGVVVNGGVIFRNMTSSDLGLTESTYARVADEGYLYVNPIIGRVLYGYAFHETSAVHTTEATSTLKNGLKNYSISDLSLSETKLSVTKSGSTYSISIPNGQAWYVLGAIVNSGAASAPNGSAEGAYDTLVSSSYLLYQGYRADCVARSGATYNYVGENGFSSQTDYTSIANLDNYASSLVKIPYIVRAYTQASSNLYLVRCVSTVNNKITVTGNCDIPAGFKGIDSIYYNNSKLRLKMYSLDGASSGSDYAYTVTLHMFFNEYGHYNVTANSVANSTSKSITAGFGLFNILEMNSPSATNSVRNLILAGNIKYDVYTVSGTKSTYPFTPYDGDNYEQGNSKIKNATAETINYATNLSVGGLAGYCSSKFYIKNVTFNDLVVESAKDAGGLIGFLNLQTNDQNYISYDANITSKGSVSAIAGFAAGGLVGRIFKTKLIITGDSSDITQIKIKEIIIKSAVPHESGLTYSANTYMAAGGLIGSAWAARKDGNDQAQAHGANTTKARVIEIKNISICKSTSGGIVKILNASNEHPEYLNYAGGFIGTAHDIILKMNNCLLDSVDVYANVSGGIVGETTQKCHMELREVNVIGDGNAKIEGIKLAGGIVGYLNNRDSFYTFIDGLTVQDYNIISTYTGSYNSFFAAGGLFALTKADNKSITDAISVPQELTNIYIANNNIKTCYTSLSYKTVGTSAFIGLITGGCNNNDINLTTDSGMTSATLKIKISGYNILLENNNIKHLNGGVSDDLANNNNIGEIVGNNLNSTPIKLVAVAINFGNRDYCGKICGTFANTNNNYGVSTVSGFEKGSIIFADYSAVQTNEALSNVKANGESITNVEVKAPYITVNPVFNLGNKTITGDGIASSIANLPLTDILSNTPSYEAAQLYAYIKALSYNNGSETIGALAEEVYSRIDMFKNEVGNNDDNPYLGPDFPILVLEDPNTINKYINVYLKMITNTDFDYTVDDETAFSIVIYNMVYNNGTFTESLNGASLKRNSSGFYVSFNAFDSGKAQFSLIDVRFKNPAYSSEVVYHLYLPVFIKKVLSFEFEISAQSGTTYLSSKYENKYGEALIENIGTPITLYFKYTYSRTTGEWQEAINSGENVYRSYSKYLKFEKANTSDQLGALPGDTLLALVDPNNSGKVYYSTFANALMQDGVTLDLSKFKLPVYANGSFTLTGDAFSSIKLCELMDLSIDNGTDAVKKFVVCDEEDAYVKVGDTYYRYATDEELSNGSITKYGIKVSGDEEINETYYLSIFTNASDNYNLFHYYLITSISKFTEGEYPAKMVNSGDSESMVHLVMGKIFYHDNFDISSDSKSHNQIMSSTNNELIVSLQAEFGLRDDLDTIIRDYMARLIESTPVYQSFLVYLNRNDGLSNNKIIIGNPDLSGTYSVDYVLDGNASGTSVNYTNINTTLSYAEFVSGDLKEYFASGNNFEIIAVVKFTYASNAIGSQFPGRNANYPDNGVTVSGSSNLAFIEGATNYSKNSISKDETPAVSYYSEEEPEIAVFDLNPLGNKVGDFTNLGINALNPVEQAAAEFELLGVLDTTSVRSLIGEYDKMIVSFSLSQKVNDTYIAVDNITTYINSIKIGSNSLSSQEFVDGKIVSSTDLDDNGAYIVLPNITVNVKTGSALEAQELMYTNYKLTITVVLETEDGVKLIASNASNYIIYTNAKVEPAFIIR